MPKTTCPNCKQEYDKPHRPKGSGYRLTTSCCSRKCQREMDSSSWWARASGSGEPSYRGKPEPVTRDDLNGNAKRQIDQLEMGEEW